MTEYLHPPVGATRLRGTGHDFSKSGSNVQAIPKVVVPLPNASPPASPSRRPFLSSMASSTLTTIPQLLLSTSLPTMMPSVQPGSSSTPSTASISGFTNYNPRGKTDLKASFLSSKDPLSLQIMTNNFKRFITIVGPLFWFQDRVEEIVLWKRGTLWTTIWMAGYTLLCLYPRLLFMLPHCVLIGAILATYPYPSNPIIDPLSSSDGFSLPPTPLVESGAPWQANIQGVQNIMGVYNDFHSIVESYVQHLCLTPAHFSTTRQSPVFNASSPPSQPMPATSSFSRSPYTKHILAILVLSFFPLLFVLHLPWFPAQTLCIIIGWIPILFTHPSNLLFSLKNTSTHWRGYCYPFEAETEVDKYPSPRPKPMSMIIQRFIDDDRLSDECWNSEMREVELWENERYNGTIPPPSSFVTDGSSFSSPSSLATVMQKGWGPQHLRSGERGPWTRSRDGSNDVYVIGTGKGVEANGDVSSNLTFSLAPGWFFVESEDWQKDLQSTWSGCGCDEDGWVYTNDSWLGSRPAPYTCGGGSLTRRRRWIRRVWYNQKMAEDHT